MDILPIKTDTDYRATLAEIEGLMGARANTPEGERLDVLVTLVEAYESAQAGESEKSGFEDNPQGLHAK